MKAQRRAVVPDHVDRPLNDGEVVEVADIALGGSDSSLQALAKLAQRTWPVDTAEA